jgi:hypothetical protein
MLLSIANYLRCIVSYSADNDPLFLKAVAALEKINGFPENANTLLNGIKKLLGDRTKDYESRKLPEMVKIFSGNEVYEKLFGSAPVKVKPLSGKHSHLGLKELHDAALSALSLGRGDEKLAAKEYIDEYVTLWKNNKDVITEEVRKVTQPGYKKK